MYIDIHVHLYNYIRINTYICINSYIYTQEITDLSEVGCVGGGWLVGWLYTCEITDLSYIDRHDDDDDDQMMVRSVISIHVRSHSSTCEVMCSHSSLQPARSLFSAPFCLECDHGQEGSE